DAEGGSMRSTTARPAISQLAGDALTSMLDENHAQDELYAQGIEGVGSAVETAVGFWPIRRSRFGGLRGAPSIARRG
ncbi:hypothetical protein ABTJ50_21615, partial [Acinetobacter baumannii]